VHQHLIVASFPVLTAAAPCPWTAILTVFSNDFGGNSMMYVNLIWIWGHPEVYILPLFGVFSEVVSTFSGKRLFGYASMVYATLVITILSMSCGCTTSSPWDRGERERVLRHHDDDHFDPDRGEDLQLAVHHVPGPRFEVPCCGRSASWSPSPSAG
jgi:cytochrome o ubiquinol oxidase subunit 1